MSDTESSLIRACLVNPFDIGPRGVYADYLMENGEDEWARERGEFINWHIQISQQPFKNSMLVQYEEWADKAWYLFHGRVPLSRHSVYFQIRTRHDIVVKVHRSGGNPNGEIVIRNGMPEEVRLSIEEFVGKRMNPGCPRCRGRGFVEMVEAPPFKVMFDFSDADLAKPVEIRKFEMPCDYCGQGYAIDIGNRWPITTLHFTNRSGYEAVYSHATRCWEFWGARHDQREVMLRCRPESIRDVTEQLIGRTAINGMRGLYHLPPLPPIPWASSLTPSRPAEPPALGHR